ncbi:2132_t:CDS:2 [Ambispora leptoticha]|uniref:2132_t:CDS:1 n=1 Tax=Ambispora leptoticha TaxID=144679 RepID=A0A9N8VXV9_9GLOM|nr:2132_t:CDS:2 [Ambispora leptoticha]
MSNQAKVAIVTGANKGIGYAIVRNLALSYYTSSSSKHPFIIYLSARNESLGKASLEQIRQEFVGRKLLQNDGGNIDIKFLKIDLTNKETIDVAAEVVNHEHGGLDILINNAGTAFKGSAFDSNVVRTTLATNFYGTLEVCNKFIPLFRPNGRLISVSSEAGSLRILSPELRKKFTDPELDIDGLIKLMQLFQDAVDRGTWKEEGWPTQAYAISKIGVTSLNRIFARHFKAEGKEIIVNACCPGWVKTDMAGPHALLTPDQGAETPVFLALDEETVPNAPNGELWKSKQIKEWHLL